MTTAPTYPDLANVLKPRQRGQKKGPKDIVSYDLDLPAILERVQGQQDEANAANQGRLDEIRGILENPAALAELDRLGEASIAEQELRGVNRKGALDADLVTRGLFNSTVAQSLGRGIDFDTDRQINLIREGVMDRRAGILERRDAALAGVLERVQDTGPDVQSYLGLAGDFMQSQNERLRSEELLDALRKDMDRDREERTAEREQDELNRALEAAPLIRPNPGAYGLNFLGGNADRAYKQVGNRRFFF
jgi:hypothetical protein